ncbi:N-6 DNA methylase [Candidatus Thiosymbion oneisti]|uniref:N-6 DNA methylase n=1 Tax=Candidatus Thiosymbion oneisti TaxID=589554 RepID=UPI000ADDF86B|nr:N-6 DNA methylase [Candidatus Thiosymbion oneisti]
MSEELIQISPKLLGRYLYYRIGSSTLSQLKKQKVIKGKFTQDIAQKKPDGLVVLTGGDVKAIIEYKQPSELQTKSQVDRAINQEIEVAKQLCKLLIVTSGKKTVWVNALNGERILSENGKELKQVFDTQPIEEGSLSNEEVVALEQLIDKIDHSLTEKNNTIALPEVLDPSQLARTIWQKIWINTGKEPEKCLYNVVELFVFKFLSDLGVLRSHNNFSSVYALTQAESSIEALKHYANICRKEIRELFPEGKDGTTVINGTIFVNEKGEPNIAQASLFGEVLRDLQDYDSEFGSFKYIKKEFKTRLYESFLRQNAGIRFLGQYFTPRNVLKAVVAMSDASQLKKGSRVCDPFCGVGGFLLELISENKQIWREFEPVDGKVLPQITVIGYDKGSDEKEDERTIILAKANMLIYFSDLLVKYPTKDYLKAFSEGAFNEVFHLLRSNLGTFGRVNSEPFDLILTNPPYVTSGSSSLKRAIDEEGLSTHYTSGGRGTETLSMEWIVSNLKIDGQALVVVPDGLLNQAVMLAYLKTYCIIQGIVSLPTRTFYSTPKKTYILVLRKKTDTNEEQESPVFTYLVSEIGETRDANRWLTDKNDLAELVSSFNQFKGAPSYFKSMSKRCKVVKFDEFSKKTNWLVDRWWSKEERVSLGVEDSIREVSEHEYFQMVNKANNTISSLLDNELTNNGSGDAVRLKTIRLDEESFFSLEIGERILKKDQLEEGIPAYSANVNEPFGFIEDSNLNDFSRPSLIWGIDGVFDWGYIPENVEFATTDHCGRLTTEEIDLHPKYIYYALKSTKDQYGFDRTYRASLKNIRQVVSVDVPVNEGGDFDLDTQIAIAERYEKLETAKAKILEQLEILSSVQVTLDNL